LDHLFFDICTQGKKLNFIEQVNKQNLGRKIALSQRWLSESLANQVSGAIQDTKGA
jgi:hypothetical protein